MGEAEESSAKVRIADHLRAFTKMIRPKVKPCALLVCALSLGFLLGLPVGGWMTIQVLRDHGREIGATAIEYGIWLASASTPEAAQWDIKTHGLEIFSEDFEAALEGTTPVASSEKREAKKAKGGKPRG